MMKVELIEATDQPERLVCRAARGDYFEGFVGDTEYPELMESVNYTDEDIKAAIDTVSDVEPEYRPTVKEVKDSGNIGVLTDAKTRAFIRKQLSRGHYGPWEHPQVTFAVSGISRVTMAQITRHRLMSFDVQSMRYADFSECEPVVPVTLLSPQERLETYPNVFDDLEDASNYYERHSGELELSDRTRLNLRQTYEYQTERQFEAYQNMVEAGVPKEDARFLLPLGTPVNMTFSGNARTFMHLMDMRKKPNAQWEVRELSERLFEELSDWMPNTFTWYDEKPHKLAP